MCSLADSGKYMCMRVYQHILLDKIDIHLSKMNNIIRLQFIIHNQLSYSVITPMISDTLFKSDNADVDPPPFQTITQVCFIFKQDLCDIHSCNQYAFILCNHCKKNIIFSRRFVNYYIHDI